MAIAAMRRPGESNEKLIGRWKKKTQQARVVQDVREKKSFLRRKSHTKVKVGALIREGHRAERKGNQFYA